MKHGRKYGFPELATKLGQVDPDCVLEADQWEAVFIETHVTTSRRVTNALRGMDTNNQISYGQQNRVVTVNAPYCV